MCVLFCALGRYLHASWRLLAEWLKMIGEQLERHQSLHKAENAGKEIAESEKQLKGLLRQFQVGSRKENSRPLPSLLPPPQKGSLLRTY